MSDDFRSLAGLLEALWYRLQPSALLALSTARVGGGVAARMVILRKSDRRAASLKIYTHSQSEKITQIANQPLGELLLWDADASFQARLGVTLSTHSGTAEVWTSLGDGARLNYAAQPEPGSTIAEPLTPRGTGIEHMTILEARINEIDVLHLGELPHARAVYHAEDGFAGRWVAP